MKRKLTKLISIVISAITVFSVLTATTFAYEYSDKWRLWYTKNAPSSANCTYTTRDYHSDGHKNIWLSCTNFPGANNGVIVNFTGSYKSGDNTISTGVSGRFTGEKAIKAYVQTKIPPYGAKTTMTFRLDYDYSALEVGYFVCEGNIRTNS